MAKAKVIVGDQGSQEFAELRKCVHTILLLLETLKTSNTADAAALLANAQAIGDAVEAGVTAAANPIAPNREVLGVMPKVKLPKTSPQAASTVNLVPSDKNY